MQQCRRTRECTPVFFERPKYSEEVTFKERTYTEVRRFKWKPFNSKKKMDIDLVEDILNDKAKELKTLKDLQKKEKEEKNTEPRVRLTWKEDVNRKRLLVATCLEEQTVRNLAEVRRFTGCSYELIRKVADDLDFCGRPTEYKYPTEKTPEQLALLHESIQKVNGTYTTSSDLQQLHPDFSRRFIQRQLKATGHRWLLMRKKRKTDRKKPYTEKQVIETVTHLAQCFVAENVDSYYLDEVHFPLFQTTDHHWTQKDYRGHDLYYNRRHQLGDKLSVIAMCSSHAFVAIQVFTVTSALKTSFTSSRKLFSTCLQEPRSPSWLTTPSGTRPTASSSPKPSRRSSSMHLLSSRRISSKMPSASSELTFARGQWSRPSRKKLSS